MNAQQLKNSILQDAIMGKLVPQDPNDEPASVLLDKIRKEKARLVKEGKLKKKDLIETPISKDEIPFEIPEGWEWVRIKYLIIGTGAGKSPNCVKRPKLFNEWGVITTTAIQYCDFHPNENKVLPSNFQINFEHVVRDKDLLITRAGPRNRTGIVCVVNKPCDNLILSDKTVRIDYIRDYCDPFYLMYTLNNPIIHDLIMSATVGMADSQVNISQINIQDIIIPLPPLAEQHRIVAKIEELLPKVEEYGKAQEALNKLNAELPERLKKSILQEAIMGKLVPQDPNDEPASLLLDKIRKEKARLVKEGKLKKKDLIETPISEEEKPFEIPESWEWVKLGWIGDWGAGATPAKGNPEFYSNGTIPWLRTGELNNGYVYDSEIKVTSKALEKCSLRMCKVGDVLIAMYGATIGKVAIAGIELTTNQACCACTSFSIYNKYLLYYLMASKQTFIEMGAGGAQPNISREKIVAFPFPLPPLAEQHRIVAKIEELLTKIDKLNTK